MVICLLAELAAITFAFLSGWSYRIEFHDTFLETHSAPVPFLQAFKCAYADIFAIGTIMPGQIGIRSRDGETLRLVPSQFEGGEERVFQALSQYIPVERFEPDLRQNYKKQPRFTNLFGFLAISFQLLALVMTLFRSQSMLPLPLGWNYFGPWSLGGSFLSSVSVESPDSIWVSQKGFSGPVVIEHLAGNQTQSWSIPNDRFWGDGERILVDSHQQPVLIKSGLVHFLKDGQWQQQDLGIEQRSLDFIEGMAVATNQYWVSYFDSKASISKLVRIQADSPQPQALTLLDPSTQKPISFDAMEIAIDGMVLLFNSFTPDYGTIYVVRNGEVQKQVYQVDIKLFRRATDFTLATDGSIYILSSDGYDPENVVEKIDLQGRQSITKLPELSHQDQFSKRYDSIEVDTRGRLWLGGTSPAFVKVLQPLWNATAQEIVQYDVNNSNYENNYSMRGDLLRTSDGRTWAADRHLIWIDSNAETLPAPLPGWPILAIQLLAIPAIIIYGVLVRRKPRRR